MTETTRPVTDLLSDALETLQASAAVFFRGSLASPWGVEIPSAQQVLDLVGRPRGAETVLMFHAVLRGAPRLELARQGSGSRLEAGDLVLLHLDQGHRLGEGEGAACLTMEGIVGGSDLRQPLVFDAGPDRDAVKLICGGFFLHNTLLHPLLGGLPPLLRVRAGRGLDELSVLLGMLARESESLRPGSRAVVRRLADLLLIRVLREAIEQGAQGGWLAALGDPVLSRALALLHDRPAAPWTVALLARRSGVSSSGLSQRFREVLGVSPARYLTRWRMHLASGFLRQPELSLAEIAERVGYGSVEAFSRSFKRVVGRSPGLWRREQGS